MQRFAARLTAASGAALLAAGQAVAQTFDGALGMPPSATKLATEVHEFHNYLLYIITAVVILVMALLLWVMVRYNRKANPKPANFSHNTLVEVIWTAGPVLILILIAFKSFPLLYKQDVFPKVAESEIVDIKTYGRQWYWSYIYGSGEDALEFDSNMIPDDQIGPGQMRKLSVDNPMVVPAGKYIRLSIAASDVIHSFAVPQFAIKTDAIPGKLNQNWFKVDEPGVYFGQCSELCGVRHAFMPIEVRVLPPAQYEAWLEKAKVSLTDARTYLDQVQPVAPTRVASVN